MKKPKSLSINTEAINEMYTFGGEGGQQLMVSENEEQAELDKIKLLAKKCVAFMNGEDLSELEKEQEKPKFRPSAPLPSTRNKNLEINVEANDLPKSNSRIF